MSIEDEIKQGKFESEHQKMVINIMFTSSWLYNNHAARLKPHGITPEQFNVLRILRGNESKKMMLAEVTTRMIDKNSNCTRLVEKLKQKGLVNRDICESNRRQVDISITNKGLALLKKLDTTYAEWLLTLKTIKQVDAKEVNRVLDKLRSTKSESF
jgi:DNA-binding MarR family transcriptional regulator